MKVQYVSKMVEKSELENVVWFQPQEGILDLYLNHEIHFRKTKITVMLVVMQTSRELCIKVKRFK